MNRETILRILGEAGHAGHAPLVETLLQPAIQVVATKLADRPALADEDKEAAAAADVGAAPQVSLDEALAALPLGASRFGGIPDLPPGVEWPTRDDVPMEFVAQLRLADVAPHDPLGRLPARGSLLFFYNSQWVTYDQDQDHACCAVIFHDGDDDVLVRTPPPRVDYQGEYDPAPRLAPYIHGLAGLTYAPFLMVPGGVSPFVAGTPLEAFWQDFHAYHGGPMSPSPNFQCHHLLGYIDGQDYVDAHANGTDDQLLFQIDSDDAASFQWGDCDRLYFVMRKDELAARDFTKVRLYSILG